MKQKIKINCLTCGRERLVQPYIIKNGYGKFCSARCHHLDMSGKKRLLPYINKSGEEHHSWKGADVGYNQLHAWVRKNKLIPDRCEDCHQVKPLDLANISQEYKRDLSDWEWLCRLCHMKKDGRLEKLRNLHK